MKHSKDQPRNSLPKKQQRCQFLLENNLNLCHNFLWSSYITTNPASQNNPFYCTLPQWEVRRDLADVSEGAGPLGSSTEASILPFPASESHWPDPYHIALPPSQVFAFVLLLRPTMSKQFLPRGSNMIPPVSKSADQQVSILFVTFVCLPHRT